MALNGVDFMNYYGKELCENLFFIGVWEHKNTTRHKHDFLELVYILEGDCIHYIDDEKCEVKAGNYFIIDHNSYHSYESKNGKTIKIVNCLFYPEYIDPMLKDCRKFSDILSNYLIKFNNAAFSKMPADNVFFDSDGEVKNLILKMIDEYKAKKTGYREILRCLLIETIILILRSVCISEKNGNIDDVSREAVSYIEKNYSERIKLSDISTLLGYSVPYLSKRFKDNLGMTFSCYLQKVRIENACRLIANTSRKIEDVSEAVGYNDVKFFNKTFKSIIGTTPREYRKKTH